MNRRPKVLAVAVALLALVVAAPVPTGAVTTVGPAASLASATVQLRPHQADAVVDAYGIGIHTPFLDTPYADADRVADALAELGVRHVRDDLFLDNPRQYAAIGTIADRGIGFDLIMGRPDRPGTPADYVRTVASLSAGAVESVEGVNEWDLFGPDDGWAAEVVGWQQELYHEVKSDPATAHLPVLSPALAFRWNYAALPDLSPWSDLANAHMYPGGYQPGTELGRITSALRAVLPTKPLVTTEAGYHNATSTTRGHRPASERAAGLYLPRLLLEHYTQGHERVYSYELVDEFADPDKTNPEAHFGLLRRDWSPKPAYTAMQTLLGLLSDPGPEFTPVPLQLDVDGWPLDGRRVVTQQRDGSYVLLLYRDVTVWDPVLRRDLSVTPAQVTLGFEDDFEITVHRVTDGPQPVSVTQGSSVEVPVDGGVTAVTLDPTPEPDPVVEPTEVTARPGHRSATVRWQLPASSGVTGFEIVRLPGGTTTRTDATSRRWRDTGLTNGRSYRYTVRALSPTGDSAAVLSPTVVPATVPGRPRVSSVQARRARVTVSWRPAAPRGRPVERYRVRVGDTTKVVGAAIARTTVRGLPGDARLRIRVQARNERGWGRAARASVRTR